MWSKLKLDWDRRTSERPNVARLLPLDSVARGFKFRSRMGQPGWGATKLKLDWADVALASRPKSYSFEPLARTAAWRPPLVRL